MRSRRRIFVLFGIFLLILSLVGSPASATPRPAEAPTLAAAAVSPADAGSLDPVTFDECADAYSHVVQPTGNYWAKNRFAGCRVTSMWYDHAPCSGCRPDGHAGASVQMISNIQPDGRQVVVSQRVEGWVVDNLPDTTQFGITVNCSAVHAGFGDAHCDVPSVTVTRTIAEWQADPIVSQAFSLQGEDLLSGSPAVQPEKRTDYALVRWFTVTPSPSEPTVDTLDPTVVMQLRCDKARESNPAYVGGADCVFPVPPVFTVSLGDPDITSAARLILDAMNDITLTYPGTAGQAVPGNQGSTVPITRMYYDTAAQDANRARAEQSCVAKWSPYYSYRPDGGRLECATYPFPDTREGANANPPGSTSTLTYAVRPVVSPEYTTLLTRLGQFLADNHVGDSDQYWVKVVA